MLKKSLIALCLFVSLPALAQQQQIQSPPEIALQINSVIGQWAQTLVQQGKLIDEQNKHIKDLEAQLAATKPEEKK